MAITDFLEESIAEWRACGTDLPDLGRRYSAGEQMECERVADECLAQVDAAARELRRKRWQPEQAQSRITAALVELTSRAFDLRDPYVDWLLGDRFAAVSTGLARQARQMDSSVGMVDILQAARNAWTACGLQALLGHSVHLTPAIFAYSMLYPYSDNYLDDVALSKELKLVFSARFGRRLEGQEMEAANAREATIWALVAVIEKQYARAAYPQVYESLLAIHAAQEQSICQWPIDGRRADLDVLRLTFTKGGTSVLADACLAAGRLTREEARFAFEWGVVLQLGDDLQDVHSDARRGSLTLYTQAAGRDPLDRITSRTLHFGRWVMEGMERLPEGRPVLKRLLQKSSQLLLIRSAATVPELYTAPYLQQLESYSPFRFEFLRQREQQVAKRRRAYGLLFEDLIQIRRNETNSRLRTFRLQNVLTRP
ncbi:MAG TPA: hypothetical protein VHU83_17480 [Bryobacteraceae bacterium]|nr:hypothetical protein [Bryobacteraceae bacterium]